jgi:hypothetical protein
MSGGVGLDVVRGRRAAPGLVSIESEVGTGTRFGSRFPSPCHCFRCWRFCGRTHGPDFDLGEPRCLSSGVWCALARGFHSRRSGPPFLCWRIYLGRGAGSGRRAPAGGHLQSEDRGSPSVSTVARDDGRSSSRCPRRRALYARFGAAFDAESDRFSCPSELRAIRACLEQAWPRSVLRRSPVLSDDSLPPCSAEHSRAADLRSAPRRVGPKRASQGTRAFLRAHRGRRDTWHERDCFTELTRADPFSGVPVVIVSSLLRRQTGSVAPRPVRLRISSERMIRKHSSAGSAVCERAKNPRARGGSSATAHRLITAPLRMPRGGQGGRRDDCHCHVSAASRRDRST